MRSMRMPRAKILPLCAALMLGACEETPVVEPCDACVLGALRCVDGRESRCEGDEACASWSEPVACGQGEVCLAGGCEAERPFCEDCVVGQTRCIDGRVGTCEGTQDCPVWSEAIDCPLDMLCVAGACAPVGSECDDCSPGQARCVDGQESLCGGIARCPKWGAAHDCDSGQVCRAGGCQACNECAPGETRCEGLQIQLCVADPSGCSFWMTTTDCPAAAPCVDYQGEKTCRVGSFLNDDAFALPSGVDACESLVWDGTSFNCVYTFPWGTVRQLGLLRFDAAGAFHSGDPIQLTYTDASDEVICSPYSHQRPDARWNGTQVVVAWDAMGDWSCSEPGTLDGIMFSPMLGLPGSPDVTSPLVPGGEEPKLLPISDGYLLSARAPVADQGMLRKLVRLDSAGNLAAQSDSTWDEAAFAFDGTKVAIVWKSGGTLKAAVLDTATLEPATPPVVLGEEASEDEYVGQVSMAAHPDRFLIYWSVNASSGPRVDRAVLDDLGNLVAGPRQAFAHWAKVRVVAAPGGGWGLCSSVVVDTPDLGSGYVASFARLDADGAPTGESVDLMAHNGFNFRLAGCTASDSHFAMCAQAEVEGEVQCLMVPR